MSQGMYPTIVIVLISLNQSMDYTLSSATNSLSVEGTIKDPVIPNHIQSFRCASLNAGAVSEEDLDIGSEVGVIEAQHA